MAIKLTFLGAARTVTGSKYLLETGQQRILIDCGMFQERDYRDRNWAGCPVPPESISAMVLTHAHLDHCGLIPKMVKDGFGGPIFTTAATAEIAQIVMNDSGKIQEEDVKYKEKRHKKEGRKGPHPYIPLYTKEDAESVESMFRPVKFSEDVEIAPGVTARFTEAGHILGAASVLLTVEDEGIRRRIQFSGDVGRWGVPIVRDPAEIGECDYIVTESTYGDKLHRDDEGVPEQLQKIFLETLDAGGNLCIPSFAVERSQDLLYYIGRLRMESKLPPLLVFLDSPMAVRVTDVFRKHANLFDDAARKLIEESWRFSDFPGLTLVRSVEQSKAINRIKGTAIIIAGSGMCTGGRIKHHIKANIGRPESTLLFVGYQAQGTMGRHLIGKPEKVRIHGSEHTVRCRIEQVHGLSGHGDRKDLLRWMTVPGPAPKRVFVTHGEPKVAEAYAATIRQERGWEASVPDYEDTVILD